MNDDSVRRSGFRNSRRTHNGHTKGKCLRWQYMREPERLKRVTFVRPSKEMPAGLRHVHEFSPLSDADIQVLLERRWAPVGIHLPAPCPGPEVIAAVIRLTRGNFRLLVRLLTQMERVVAINGLETLSVDVVETARENLVISLKRSKYFTTRTQSCHMPNN